MSEVTDKLASNLTEALGQNRHALLEMTQSAGWKVWLEWSASMRSGLANVALRDGDPATREEARMQLVALEKFERLPFMLVELSQEGS